MEAIIPQEVEIKIKESEALSVSYENYSIVSAEQYQFSAEDLKKIKAKAKELNDTRMSLTRPIEESKKKIIALFNKPLEFLAGAESSIKRAMVNWQNEQEKLRRAEEARLAEIQRVEAEKLRIRAEKEAAKADSLKTEKGREAAAARAEELAAQAEITAAIAPVVESKIEEVFGISTRKVWKYEIIDLTILPREYMIPDESYIGKIVRASQGKKEIPGVKIYSENTIASRI